MKQFKSFVIKETRHILRDKRTMLILFGMPMVMMLLFGFAISTDVKNVRTVVVNVMLREYLRGIVGILLRHIRVRSVSDNLNPFPFASEVLCEDNGYVSFLSSNQAFSFSRSRYVIDNVEILAGAESRNHGLRLMVD